MNPVVTARGVEKSFPLPQRGKGRLSILRGVDLDISAGEFVAIVGRSGSGKSTLLHCLSGILPIDNGSIEISGIRMNPASKAQRARLRRDRVGFVFQDLNLLGSLTVRDNVLLPARLAGMRINKRVVEAALTQVGLADKARSYPDQLSGGQRQRVAIARVVVREPDVIFADEPTGSLDVETSGEVMALLRECTGRATALVTVTHDLEVAATADRVVVLDGGQCRAVLQRPTPEQVFDALREEGQPMVRS